MSAFSPPLLLRPGAARPVRPAATRRRPGAVRMRGSGPLRAAGAAALGAVTAAALQLGCVDGAQARTLLLGEQAEPVRTSSVEAVTTSRLPARWEVRSHVCATATYVVVANESPAPVDLLWVNYAGEEVQYATIAPGRIILQPSYASHPWVVRDHKSQNSILFVMAQEDPAIAVVSGTRGTARAENDARLQTPVSIAAALQRQ